MPRHGKAPAEDEEQYDEYYSGQGDELCFDISLDDTGYPTEAFDQGFDNPYQSGFPSTVPDPNH